MNQPNETPARSQNGSRWIWLGGMWALAMAMLSAGKTMVAAGFLLMGVATFFIDPLSPTPLNPPRPSPVEALAWLCGLVGIGLIVAAALG